MKMLDRREGGGDTYSGGGSQEQDYPEPSPGYGGVGEDVPF